MITYLWRPGSASSVEVKGKKLESVCYGPAPDEATTIILLHEGLGCIALWRDFPQNLSDATGLGVFVYSRAGYGASDPVPLPRPLDYMTREAKEVLPALLDALGVQKVILLGHSDGASIAAIYAGSVIDFRVRGLVLMAPHFFTEALGLAAISDARTAYNETDLRAKLATYHSQVDVSFRGWNEAWLDPGFVAWNISEVIDYWRIPVLGIQGRDDQYGSLAHMQEMQQRSYAPVEIEIIDDCKHSPHLEQAEHTLTLIVRFVHRLLQIDNTVVQTN